MNNTGLYWWQTGVIYQVYPRSFQDSNNDGVGDLPGITQRVDYLQWLGVDAVWLSPMYPSPMADFGYDVADYTDVDPVFGTLADLDQLRDALHERGMKLILDLVPNHSSDEHPWFIESRASRDNPKRDWYVWRDPAPDGGVPNNWISHFGGSAWTWDAATGQYYLHLFDPKQPDLNWRNPAVRAAMYDVMRFWFDRGIDGFRIDVLWQLIKDANFRDNLINPDYDPTSMWYIHQHIRVHTEDLPETHEIVREMRAVADEYDERVLIGEVYLPYAQLMTYYGSSMDEVHMPFNFALLLLNDWSAGGVRALVEEYEAALPAGAQPNWVLGNHDQPRIASRRGAVYARLAQMLLLTLRGTPTCYYGDELGMEDVPIPPEMVHDPQAKTADFNGRDPERTPMQWDTTPNAGFTAADVQPWLPVAGDAVTRNVAVQQTDPTSMLSFMRHLLAVRRQHAALNSGTYRTLDNSQPEQVYSFVRTAGTQQILVVLNFSDQPQQVQVMGVAQVDSVLCSTTMGVAPGVSPDPATLSLQPYEGQVLLLA